MSLLSFITSAAGGTILGGVTQLLGSAVGELKEWSASKRRIAEIAALKEKAISIAEVEAFAKAVEGTTGSTYAPPPSAPNWMHGLMVISAFATQMVRPLMVAGACAYIWTRPADQLAGLQPEILTVSFACVYFWLGVRHQLSKSK
jgi:hypothetical protein